MKARDKNYLEYTDHDTETQKERLPESEKHWLMDLCIYVRRLIKKYWIEFLRNKHNIYEKH